jgi:hypothetical protein
MSSAASFPICSHLHTTGKRCGSPSLRGEQYCYYHHPTRRPARRPKAHVPFTLPLITDRTALQIALCEVMARLADNTLDLKRAGAILQTLQMAGAQL